MWHKMATAHGNRLVGCIFTHFSMLNPENNTRRAFLIRVVVWWLDLLRR
jgi:hypothetical protein